MLLMCFEEENELLNNRRTFLLLGIGRQGSGSISSRDGTEQGEGASKREKH